MTETTNNKSVARNLLPEEEEICVLSRTLRDAFRALHERYRKDGNERKAGRVGELYQGVRNELDQAIFQLFF